MKEEKQSTKEPQAAYGPYDYRRFVEDRQTSDEDRIRSSSINSVGSLAATIGVGSMIAGKQRTGSTIAAGAAGGMASYHIARILKAKPAIQLLAAALGATVGSASVYAAKPFGLDK